MGVISCHLYADAMKSLFLLRPLLNSITSLDNVECTEAFADAVSFYKMPNSMVKETIGKATLEVE